MQKVIITGNIGNDATITQGEHQQYRFSVGVFNGKDQQGNNETAWYTVFSPMFQKLQGRLLKGSKVTVLGTLKPGVFVGNDGIARLDLTVGADTIEIHESLPTAATQPQPYNPLVAAANYRQSAQQPVQVQQPIRGVLSRAQAAQPQAPVNYAQPAYKQPAPADDLPFE